MSHQTTPPTKAQLLAAQYAQAQHSGLPPDPATNPAWHDRERVPSPPRRTGAVPRVVAAGQTDVGLEAHKIETTVLTPLTPSLEGTPYGPAPYADGGGSTPPPPSAYGADAFLTSSAHELNVPEAVKTSPTFKGLGSQAAVDRVALEAAARVAYLVERAPDEMVKIFRTVLGHPVLGVVTYGHLPDAVRDGLLGTFFRIISRKPWIFQVCRLIFAIRGDITIPKLIRTICTLAANHAFLAYADVVSPFGHLEDLARSANARDYKALTGELPTSHEEEAEVFAKEEARLAAKLEALVQSNDPADTPTDVPGPPPGESADIIEALLEKESLGDLTDDEFERLDELTAPDDSDAESGSD